jgi:hypothetical protein
MPREKNYIQVRLIMGLSNFQLFIRKSEHSMSLFERPKKDLTIYDNFPIVLGVFFIFEKLREDTCRLVNI